MKFFICYNECLPDQVKCRREMKAPLMIISAILLLLPFGQAGRGFSQNIGINSTGAIANPSALLDVDAAPGNNVGILIPRISLSDVSTYAPITGTQTASLMVYNTNATLTGGNGVGYYYWSGTKWIYIPAPSNGPGTSGQVLTSNGAAAPIWQGVGVLTGVIQLYAGSSIPSGYLNCDGSAVSRATYAALFAVIDITYGAGDGSTTFNLPDLQQRFPLGKAIAGTGSTLGGTGGSIDHTHTGPNHNHTFAPAGTISAPVFTGAAGTTVSDGVDHTHSTPAHFHGFGAGSGLSGGSGTSDVSSANHTHTYSGTTSAVSNDHTHTGTTSTNGNHQHTQAGYNLVGSSGPIPWYNWGNSAFSTNDPNTGAAGAHDHSFTTGGISANHTHTFSGTSSGFSADHSHTTPAHSHTGTIGLVTGGVDGNAAITSGNASAFLHTHAFTPAGTVSAAVFSGSAETTGSDGTGTTGANNPPFLVVNYIIKD